MNANERESNKSFASISVHSRFRLPASANVRAAISASSNSGLDANVSNARGLLSLIPSSLPTTALISCQKGHWFKIATRRFTSTASVSVSKPDAASPLHMPRTALKTAGIRAYTRWLRVWEISYNYSS